MAATPYDCRECTLTTFSPLWLDAQNKPTDKPICQSCYERLVTRTAISNCGERQIQYKPGYQQRIYNGGYSE